MPRTPALNGLTLLAWANVSLHVGALALAAVGMRPGSPLVPLPERLAYLARSPLGWTLGWASWMLCAVLLIAFLATVTGRLSERAEVGRLGLTIAVTGAGFDLFCDTIYLVVFPRLASWEPPPEPLFLTVERITGIGSLVIANGAYSVGILLINVALHARRGVGRLTIGVGYAVGLAGLVLAAAGFTGEPAHAEWATPPTISLFCVWVVLVTGSLDSGGGPA
jgi:hypothetical protein